MYMKYLTVIYLGSETAKLRKRSEIILILNLKKRECIKPYRLLGLLVQDRLELPYKKRIGARGEKENVNMTLF